MSGSLHSALAAAILNLLRPLVRILLRNGIPYGAFAELAKKVYTDVAAEDFAEPGKKTTISRISALTGLTRKEAKRLHELQSPQESSSNERYNRAVRVISGWVNDPTYQDASGQPALLPGGDGPGSFGALVRQYSGDVPTHAMLSVLEAAGSIAQREGGVQLVRHAYVPGSDPVDKIHILGNDAFELMTTIDHNLTAPVNALRFQRKVSNHAVRADALPAFRLLSSQKAQALLEELDDWLTRHEAEPTADASAQQYVSLGIYYFERKDSHEVNDE